RIVTRTGEIRKQTAHIRVAASVWTFFRAGFPCLQRSRALSWLSLHSALAVVRVDRNPGPGSSVLVVRQHRPIASLAPSGTHVSGADPLRPGLLCSSTRDLSAEAIRESCTHPTVAQPLSSVHHVVGFRRRTDRRVHPERPRLALDCVPSTAVRWNVLRPAGAVPCQRAY